MLRSILRYSIILYLESIRVIKVLYHVMQQCSITRLSFRIEHSKKSRITRFVRNTIPLLVQLVPSLLPPDVDLLFFPSLTMSSRIEKRRLKPSSTVRRKQLVEFIKEFGKEIPTKCTPCREAGRIYRVYVRSGRYGYYNTSNNPRYNIRVTASEFRRLSKERASLREKMSLYKEELEAARLTLDTAYKRYITALAK